MITQLTILISVLSFTVSSCNANQGTPPTSTPPKRPETENPAKLTQQPGISLSSPVDTNIFVNLSKKVVPSVVNISTSKTVKSPLGQGNPDDVFRKFFEDFLGPGLGNPQWNEQPKRNRPPQPPKNLPKAVSLGTGFIIDPSGLILTNNHVVADADEIKINFTEAADELPTDGEVVGRDEALDVALIKVKSKREMVALSLGNSDTLEVGEYVMAVGNPFGQGHSVTHGIISAKGRIAPGLSLATYLQTDAPINPGNSGGPLVNLKGEVIGINNAIDARAQGIGFAIPIDLVTKILPQLKTKGTVDRGYMGAVIAELTPELAAHLGAPKDLRAPFVTNVTPGEPADKAGIKAYDIILEVNDKKVSTSSELVGLITSVPVGDSAKIKLFRAGKDPSSGKEHTVQVKVAKRPGSGQERSQGAKKPNPSSHIDTGMTIGSVTGEIAEQLGIPSSTKGVVVSSIDYGSPADKAGLNRGDVIVEVDRKPVHDTDSFYSIVSNKKSYLLRVMKPSAGQGQPVYGVSVLDLKNSE